MLGVYKKDLGFGAYNLLDTQSFEIYNSYKQIR